MRLLSAAVVLGLVATGFVSAQEPSPFIGTFAIADGSVVLRIKPVASGFHGAVQTAAGWLVLDAKANGGKLEGTVYTQPQTVPLVAVPIEGGLNVSTAGVTTIFMRVSTDHQLEGVDLSPYMTATPQAPPGGPGPDFDESYSQADPGHATENRSTTPSAPAPAPGAVQHSDPALFQAIAGSRLAYYTRTSILNDSTASSLTFVSFCPDSRFYVQTEGSFSVEGYGGNAQGANRGQRSGTWQIFHAQGVPSLRLVFADGTVTEYPINLQGLYDGRWRVGNTQYAIERGKAVCY